MKRIVGLLVTTALIMGLTITAQAADYGEYDNGYYNNYNHQPNYYYNDGYHNHQTNYYYNDGYIGNDYYNVAPYHPAWEMFERPFEGYPARTAIGHIGEITETAHGHRSVEILCEDGKVKMIAWLMLPPLGHTIIDAATGEAAELTDANGGKVLVIYGPLNTYHEPRQANALVIAINIGDEEGRVLPHHHTIEAIEPSEDGESLKLTVDNGDLIVSLDKDTQLMAHLTRQVVVLDEFQVGDEVLLWYGIVAQSHPAQTTAARALRLRAAHTEVDETDNIYDYADEYEYEYDYPGEYVDEYTNDYEPIPESRELYGQIQVVDINLYRVGINAEAMGYSIYWNVVLQRAELVYGDKHITLQPGSAVMYVNGAPHSMSAPSLIQNDRLFAPKDFFENL